MRPLLQIHGPTDSAPTAAHGYATRFRRRRRTGSGRSCSPGTDRRDQRICRATPTAPRQPASRFRQRLHSLAILGAVLASGFAASATSHAAATQLEVSRSGSRPYFRCDCGRRGHADHLYRKFRQARCTQEHRRRRPLHARSTMVLIFRMSGPWSWRTTTRIGCMSAAARASSTRQSAAVPIGTAPATAAARASSRWRSIQATRIFSTWVQRRVAACGRPSTAARTGFRSTTGMGEPAVYSIVVDPFHHNVIYAGTLGYGAFRSTNGGASWIGARDRFDRVVIAGRS